MNTNIVTLSLFLTLVLNAISVSSAQGKVIEKPDSHPIHRLNRGKREIRINADFNDFSKLGKFYNKYACVIFKIGSWTFGGAGASISIRIKEIHSISQIDQRTKDKILLRTGIFIVKNHSNSTAEAQSHSFSYKKIYTESLSIANTKGFIGTIKIPIAGVELNPTVIFSNTETTTKTESIEELVTIPPQKVILSPRSMKNVKYKLYRQEIEQKYDVTFTVDPSSELSVTCFSGIFSGHIRTKYLYLLDYIKFMYEKNKLSVDTEFIEYNYAKNELLIKNYCITRTLVTDIVEVTLGDEESLE